MSAHAQECLDTAHGDKSAKAGMEWLDDQGTPSSPAEEVWARQEPAETIDSLASLGSMALVANSSLLSCLLSHFKQYVR